MGPALRRLVVIVVLLLSFSLSQQLAVAGNGGQGSFEHLAVVRGHSMEPLLHTGDIVLLEKKDPADIAVGDIVVYRWGSTYVIHRVAYVYRYAGRWCYVVWGDNRLTNPIPDPGDPLICGSVAFRDPVSGALVEASGIPYSWVIGVVVSFHGMTLKIPYLGGLALLVR